MTGKLSYQNNLINAYNAYREIRPMRNIKLGCGLKIKWKAWITSRLDETPDTNTLCFSWSPMWMFAVSSDFVLFIRTYWLKGK